MPVISKTATINLHAPLREVFPLFGPLREQEWAEGWKPRMITEHSTAIEQHMVFQTEAHDAAHPETYTWVLSNYDPDRAIIEYTVFASDRLWWITVACQQGADQGLTSANITYTYVGLTPDGDERNSHALEAMYLHELKDWQVAINHYLETGSQLSHAHKEAHDV